MRPEQASVTHFSSLKISTPLFFFPSNSLNTCSIGIHVSPFKCKNFQLTSPNSSSNLVSTPYLGNFSPVKLFAWHSGLLTPEMWDIWGAPPWSGTAFFFFVLLLVSTLFTSSVRSDGKSNSCCLSAKKKK